jgi:hypothetical protein
MLYVSCAVLRVFFLLAPIIVIVVGMKFRNRSYPMCSMYGIFTYIWAIFGVNVGKYSIHGASGYVLIIFSGAV